MLADTAGNLRFTDLRAELERNRPLVHNITNCVVRTGTAEAIAATGGTQMTVDAEDEAADVASLAHSLVINSGTPDAAWLRAAIAAAQRVGERGARWVLDPVAVGVSRYRNAVNAELASLAPAIIKGNASEILAMAHEGVGGHAGDNRHDPNIAFDAAPDLARQQRCVVVVTGAMDAVTDGQTTYYLANGTRSMAQMIGSGCLLGAVLACYLASTDDPFEAALAGVAHFTVSGELAAEYAAGPGSLHPALIDALAYTNAEHLTAHLRLSEAPLS